jgi:16S rRNA (uracil1498-N3)-methyltransferase
MSNHRAGHQKTQEVGRGQVTAAFCLTEMDFVPGATITLGDAVDRHLRARRLGVGARIALLDGEGHRALGTLIRAQPHFAVELESVAVSAPPSAVHLLVPIADRDRTLWLAEKCVELGTTTWRPVLYRRSRGVKPRAEGITFVGKVRARMTSALEQSESVWLPAVFPDAMLGRALDALPGGGTRLLLDIVGEPLLATNRPALVPPVTVAVGPEGGLEDDERAQLIAAGFTPVRLGGHVLRFETAAIAGLAVIRCQLESGVHDG